MSEVAAAKKRDFLYTDENVKYSVSNNGKNITIHCDHPIFTREFNSSETTQPLDGMFANVQKGNQGYAFFEKLRTSVQEYYLDLGV